MKNRAKELLKKKNMNINVRDYLLRTSFVETAVDGAGDATTARREWELAGHRFREEALNIDRYIYICSG